jgi:hypothetical protein
MYRRRVSRDDRVAGIVRRCPECGTEMRSLPELYWDDESLVRIWSIGFFCPEDRETFPIWAPEYQALIDEVTKDVDIESLPLWPEGHRAPTGVRDS